MKNTDSDKVKKALVEMSKLKFKEDKDGGNDFKRGMASMADMMLDILFSHGNSIEYRTAVRDIVLRSK